MKKRSFFPLFLFFLKKQLVPGAILSVLFFLPCAVSVLFSKDAIKTSLSLLCGYALFFPVLALIPFSHCYKRSSSDFLTSLCFSPAKRFFACYLSVIFSSLLCLAGLLGGLLGMCALNNAEYYFTFDPFYQLPYLFLLLISVIYATGFFSLSCVLAKSKLSALLLSLLLYVNGALLFTPLPLKWINSDMLPHFLTDWSDGVNLPLTQILKMPSFGSLSPTSALCALVWGLLLSAAALLLYTKRRNERAGSFYSAPFERLGIPTLCSLPLLLFAVYGTVYGLTEDPLWLVRAGLLLTGALLSVGVCGYFIQNKEEVSFKSLCKSLLFALALCLAGSLLPLSFIALHTLPLPAKEIEEVRLDMPLVAWGDEECYFERYENGTLFTHEDLLAFAGETLLCEEKALAHFSENTALFKTEDTVPVTVSLQNGLTLRRYLIKREALLECFRLTESYQKPLYLPAGSSGSVFILDHQQGTGKKLSLSSEQCAQFFEAYNTLSPEEKLAARRQSPEKTSYVFCIQTFDCSDSHHSMYEHSARSTEPFSVLFEPNKGGHLFCKADFPDMTSFYPVPQGDCTEAIKEILENSEQWQWQYQ